MPLSHTFFSIKVYFYAKSSFLLFNLFNPLFVNQIFISLHMLQTYGNKKTNTLDRSFTKAKEIFANLKTKLYTNKNKVSANYRIELSVTNEFIDEHKQNSILNNAEKLKRLTHIDASIVTDYENNEEKQEEVGLSSFMNDVEIRPIDHKSNLGDNNNKQQNCTEIYCDGVEEVFYYDYESEIDDLYSFNKEEIITRKIIKDEEIMDDTGIKHRGSKSLDGCLNSIQSILHESLLHKPGILFKNKSEEEETVNPIEFISKYQTDEVDTYKDSLTLFPQSGYTRRQSSLCIINNKNLLSSDSTEDNSDSEMNVIKLRKKGRKTNKIKYNHINPDIKMTSSFIKSYLNLKTIKFRTLPKDRVIKINEATFSDVYSVGSKVIKILPLQGITNECDFLRESYIAKELSKEDGIIYIHDVFIANGCYPTAYLNAWHKFVKKENKRPPRGKIDWGIIIMKHGGIDLENFKFSNLTEVFFFFKRLLTILNNLEEKYEFEHRDLHWGNIMLKRNKEMSWEGLSTFDFPNDYNPFKISIIDFTLSRIALNNKIVYTDLSVKKWLFEGDERVDIQYRVYKKMKRDDYSTFDSRCNFYWFEYLVHKIEERWGVNEVIVFYKKRMEGVDTIKELYKKIRNEK